MAASNTQPNVDKMFSLDKADMLAIMQRFYTDNGHKAKYLQLMAELDKEPEHLANAVIAAAVGQIAEKLGFVNFSALVAAAAGVFAEDIDAETMH